MPTKRIIVTIPDEDKLWLEAYSKMHKISMAEAIRRGIGQLKQNYRHLTYQKLVEETCGVWTLGNGLDYQRKIRAEWD